MSWNHPPDSLNPALNPAFAHGGRRSDWVSLSRFRLQAVIGVYPHERLHPQPLDIDLAMQLDTRIAATTLNLAKSIDYAKVARDLRLLIQGARFHLLETAAEAIAAFLLAPSPDRACPESVQVKLHKPSALDGLATPSVAIHRTPADFLFVTGDLPSEIRIFASADVKISLLEIPPGGFLPSASQIFIPLCEGDQTAERALAITRCGDREFLTKPTQAFDFQTPFEKSTAVKSGISADAMAPQI